MASYLAIILTWFCFDTFPSLLEFSLFPLPLSLVKTNEGAPQIPTLGLYFFFLISVGTILTIWSIANLMLIFISVLCPAMLKNHLTPPAQFIAYYIRKCPLSLFFNLCLLFLHGTNPDNPLSIPCLPFISPCFSFFWSSFLISHR